MASPRMVSATSTSSSVKPRLMSAARWVVTRPGQRIHRDDVGRGPGRLDREARAAGHAVGKKVTPRQRRIGFHAQEGRRRRGWPARRPRPRGRRAGAARTRASESSAHLERLLARDGLLARGAQEGGEPGHLGAHPHVVGGPADRGRHHRGGHREDREDDDQLHQGVAAASLAFPRSPRRRSRRRPRALRRRRASRCRSRRGRPGSTCTGTGGPTDRAGTCGFLRYGPFQLASVRVLHQRLEAGPRRRVGADVEPILVQRRAEQLDLRPRGRLLALAHAAEEARPHQARDEAQDDDDDQQLDQREAALVPEEPRVTTASQRDIA